MISLSKSDSKLKILNVKRQSFGAVFFYVPQHSYAVSIYCFYYTQSHEDAKIICDNLCNLWINFVRKFMGLMQIFCSKGLLCYATKIFPAEN